MIVSLILILLLIVFMAFFIGMNLSNACTFWFFKTYTDLPVAVLALIAFGAGKFVHRKNSKRKLRQKKSSVLQKKSRLKKKLKR